MSDQRVYRLIEDLIQLFERDLNRLEQEVASFPSDQSLWVPRDGVHNCAGNLTLHLCGNLRHFVGHLIGQSGYERKRESEFTLKDLTRAQLITEIHATLKEVQHALEHVDTTLLDAAYPIEVFGKPMSHRFFLIHLSGHLNYHLGQINYYRRLN